jgi:hypothetical protein
MFQRADPQPSDKNLGNFYGLALPLLMRGIPVEPVQIESASDKRTATNFLSRYKILLLSYEGQKPPLPDFHTALNAWVKAGGALIVVDNDKDPYNQATDWWNSDGNHFATPREPLFQTLGIPASAPEMSTVGRGFVLYLPQSPSALTYNKSGADVVMKLLQTAAAAIHLALKETNDLVLRRGPYIIAAGLGQESQDTSKPQSGLTSHASIAGDLINLFDADLAETSTVLMNSGTRALLLDVDYFKSSEPRILAASAKITNEQAHPDALVFDAEGIDQTNAVVRILSGKAPRSITVNNKPLDADHYQRSGRTFLLRFLNSATPQAIQVNF